MRINVINNTIILALVFGLINKNNIDKDIIYGELMLYFSREI